jgi:hypothetical protein
VSDQAAAQALEKVAASGDKAAAEKVVRLLLRDETISQRVDFADIEDAVVRAAGEMAQRGSAPSVSMAALESALKSGTGTTLIAIFSVATVSTRKTVGCTEFGPAHALLDDSSLALERGDWGALGASDQLAIRVTDPALAGRGRRVALQWLRGALGALYLAGRAIGGVDVRVGPVPADDLAPSVFVGPPNQLACLVHAMRLPLSVPLDIDKLLANTEAVDLMADCLGNDRSDLVSLRMRDAAPWIQLAFDALAYPDAVLSLGISLEALIGSESPADVVKVVSTRAAFLLREGRSRSDRAISGGEWRARTKRLYDARSRVAHGRYTEGTLSAEEQWQVRRDFEDLVCRVAVEFRNVGRRQGWTTDKDLRSWQDELEMG